MRFSSIFDEPIRKLEREFFARKNDSFSLSCRRSPPVLPRPELLDKREYNEIVESSVGDDEILKNSETELVMKINCVDFKPEEITVTVEDNQLSIECLQERVYGNSKIKRQFSRKIQLPSDSLTKEMDCTAKTNGILTIIIPRKPVEKEIKNEKIIPIRLEDSINHTSSQQASSQQQALS